MTLRDHPHLAALSPADSVALAFSLLHRATRADSLALDRHIARLAEMLREAKEARADALAMAQLRQIEIEADRAVGK